MNQVVEPCTGGSKTFDPSSELQSTGVGGMGKTHTFCKYRCLGSTALRDSGRVCLRWDSSIFIFISKILALLLLAPLRMGNEVLID